MNYTKKKKDEYNIHFIENKGFHTLEIRVLFTSVVSKEKLTMHNMITDILTYATCKYPTRRDLLHKCQELYSLFPIGGCRKYGNYLLTTFGISILDSMYINQDNIIDNIELIKEILFNPLSNGNKFDDKLFELVKKDQLAETRTIKEQPRLLCNYNLMKKMSDKENFALTGYSDLEVLEHITSETLYKEYQNMLENSKIDIFVSGNIKNIPKIEEAIMKNFIFHNKFQSLPNPYFVHKKKKRHANVFVDTFPYMQSKISIGYKCFNLNLDENRFIINLLNSILGGGSDSMLMKEIREEKTLCYYIGSYINKLDNILVINSGIEKENYEKVLELVEEIFNKLRNGKFTKQALNNAKMEYLMELERITENNRSIIDYYYGREVFNSLDVEKRREKIAKFTKDDVMKLANKIHLDTIYYLKGDL